MWKLFRVVALALGLSLAAWPALAEQLDINTATQDQLTSLKGVGPVKARAIVAYRNQRGRFDSVADLTEVKGIGPAFIEQNRALLTVSEPDNAAP